MTLYASIAYESFISRTFYIHRATIVSKPFSKSFDDLKFAMIHFFRNTPPLIQYVVDKLVRYLTKDDNECVAGGQAYLLSVSYIFKHQGLPSSLSLHLSSFLSILLSLHLSSFLYLSLYLSCIFYNHIYM